MTGRVQLEPCSPVGMFSRFPVSVDIDCQRTIIGIWISSNAVNEEEDRNGGTCRRLTRRRTRRKGSRLPRG